MLFKKLREELREKTDFKSAAGRRKSKWGRYFSIPIRNEFNQPWQNLDNRQPRSYLCQVWVW
jgi:hypothetical protein